MYYLKYLVKDFIASRLYNLSFEFGVQLLFWSVSTSSIFYKLIYITSYVFFLNIPCIVYLFYRVTFGLNWFSSLWFEIFYSSIYASSNYQDWEDYNSKLSGSSSTSSDSIIDLYLIFIISFLSLMNWQVSIYISL